MGGRTQGGSEGQSTLINSQPLTVPKCRRTIRVAGVQFPFAVGTFLGRDGGVGRQASGWRRHWDMRERVASGLRIGHAVPEILEMNRLGNSW